MIVEECPLLTCAAERSALGKLPDISIVIPTKDRPEDLANLLSTIISQCYPPLEVIIVDDSLLGSAKQIFDSFASKPASHLPKFVYLAGSKDGLTAARNQGVKKSRGNAVLFLDDDTLIDRTVVKSLATFLRNNPLVMGIQPRVVSTEVDYNDAVPEFENALRKALMISYYVKDESRARRSGSFVYPQPLTKVIPAQRFAGCCCCYRREVFNSLSFDTNLKRWGFSEDLDFSYRAYKKNPGSLFILPDIKIIHKSSPETRPAINPTIRMRTIHWYYLFFKNMFNGSMLNLLAFFWAIEGELIFNLGDLVVRKGPKPDWWRLIYLIGSHIAALRNLRDIIMGRLEFFSKTLST